MVSHPLVCSGQENCAPLWVLDGNQKTVMRLVYVLKVNTLQVSSSQGPIVRKYGENFLYEVHGFAQKVSKQDGIHLSLIENPCFFRRCRVRLILFEHHL